jgi:hypothetical protein
MQSLLEENISNLEPGQTPQDRTGLVSKVYRAKLRDIKNLLIQRSYFGEDVAYVHVTKFQRGGLPHEHILLIMRSGSKLRSLCGYDKVISVKIPDKGKYHMLHNLVIKHMLHGPCGVLNRKVCLYGRWRVLLRFLVSFVQQHNREKVPTLCIGGEMMAAM